MKIHHFEITKKYSIFIDSHGSGFANGFVLFPTLTIHYHKNYLQFTFCIFTVAKSLTVMSFEDGSIAREKGS